MVIIWLGLQPELALCLLVGASCDAPLARSFDRVESELNWVGGDKRHFEVVASCRLVILFLQGLRENSSVSRLARRWSRHGDLHVVIVDIFSLQVICSENFLQLLLLLNDRNVSQHLMFPPQPFGSDELDRFCSVCRGYATLPRRRLVGFTPEDCNSPVHSPWNPTHWLRFSPSSSLNPSQPSPANLLQVGHTLLNLTPQSFLSTFSSPVNKRH